MLPFLKYNSGYIAVEFGGIFKGYGSEVHIIIRKDKILTGFDEDTRTHLQEQMIEQGFHIHTMTNIAKVTKEAEDSYVVSLIEKNGTELDLKVDLIMAATGRKPKVDGLGLEQVGVAINERTKEIIVNESGQTSIDSIFAKVTCALVQIITEISKFAF